MRKLGGGLVVVVLGLAVTGCGDDDDGDASPAGGEGGATVRVTAVEFAFDPDEAEAEAGAITFEVSNEDGVAHTFTIDDAGVDIALDADASGSATETLDAGAYEFRCTIHPAMTGSLTVS